MEYNYLSIPKHQRLRRPWWWWFNSGLCNAFSAVRMNIMQIYIHVWRGISTRAHARFKSFINTNTIQVGTKQSQFLCQARLSTECCAMRTNRILHSVDSSSLFFIACFHDPHQCDPKAYHFSNTGVVSQCPVLWPLLWDEPVAPKLHLKVISRVVWFYSSLRKKYYDPGVVPEARPSRK